MPKLSPTYKMQFRRRREGKTNYKRRLKLLLSKKVRLVVRRSLKYIVAQLIKFDEGRSDRVIASATSKELKKFGWKYACDNLPSAYLTGLLIGKRAIEKGIEEAILNIGLYTSTKGARIYAVAKGAIDAGLKIPISEEVIPSEERIKGKHIADFLPKFKDITQDFEKIKNNILGG